MEISFETIFRCIIIIFFVVANIGEILRTLKNGSSSPIGSVIGILIITYVTYWLILTVDKF